MSADAIAIVKFLFETIWKLFTSWYIPGTNVTPAAMAFFLMVSSFTLKTLAWMLNRGIFDGPMDNTGEERLGRHGGKRF